ncbi:MAG: hypothetical protein ACM3P1_08675 [Candidatus Saccharibacteria bacterium]
MVKKTLLLVLALFNLQLSFGQVLHVQFGPTISNLEWSVEDIRRVGTDKTLTGRSAFIGLDYLNSRHFNLSTNIGYLQKGDKSDIAYIKGEGDILLFPGMTALFEYFSINTLAEIKIPIWQHFIPYISLGPRVDYLYTYSKDFSFIEEMNGLPHYSYGANMGGGIKLDFRRLQIGVRSDYYLNVRKMADWVSNSNDSGWIDDQTYLVNMTIGYKLR